MFVLDCSVTMAWLFEDEKTDFSEKMLNRLEKERAVVPALWFLEVMNVLLVAEKRNRCTSEQSMRFLEMLRSLPIDVDDEMTYMRCESLLLLARSHTLTSYDAAYLDVAFRKGIAIATLDSHLREASKEAGVTILT